MKSFVLCTIALAASALLAPLARPQQQKPAAPTQEERIKKLEDRADAAEKAAAMQKDYIEKAQKDVKDYYEKAFDTQTGMINHIALFVTVVLALIALFSFRVFDYRTKIALKETTNQLHREYAKALEAEVQKLKDDIRAILDYETRNSRGLIFAALTQYDDATDNFRHALEIYKANKALLTQTGTFPETVILNIAVSLKKHDPNNFPKNFADELARPLYEDLDPELNALALAEPELYETIRRRKETSKGPSGSAPPADARKTAAPAPADQPQAPPATTEKPKP